MQVFGERIGRCLKGGEVLELVGDVGAGKTTLTKSIAKGMGITSTIQSPTFTISNRYQASDDLELVHYDFYRLNDAGLMADELTETLHDEKTVTVIEWADIVAGVLPADHLTVSITAQDEQSRQVECTAGGPRSAALLEQLR